MQMTIFGQNLQLSLLAVFDPTIEPGELYPSCRARTLREGEVLATYYLRPGRRNRFDARHIKRGVRNLQMSGPETFSFECIGEMNFLVAEILSEPVRDCARLVKSRLLSIEKYCET